MIVRLPTGLGLRFGKKHDLTFKYEVIKAGLFVSLQIFLATSHGKLRSYSTSPSAHGQPVLKEELPVCTYFWYIGLHSYFWGTVF